MQSVQLITPSVNVPQPDLREQMWNDGAIGPVTAIQLPAEAITSLRGILFDIDPKLLRTSSLIPALPEDPRDLYTGVVRSWLDQNPTLTKAEVRMSGTGLHVILRFPDPVAFHTDNERNHWAGIVQVVQAALPIDPDQPGIIATTRPIGSTNSKNGRTVELLTAGQPVTVDEVLSLYDQMITAPFSTVMTILGGGTVLQPCPVCNAAGTRLTALNFVGKCYGSCGQVNLEDLYDVCLIPRSAATEER